LKRLDQLNKDKRVIILKTPNEVQRFLKEVQ
ncbi:topology modulation protein, partial [Bacillus cereus]